eukprot:jgi/Mesen1/7054/ME000369S06378
MAVTVEVLLESGFDADGILHKASSQRVKDELRQNTATAVELGICGAPTFRVLDPEGCHVALVWGQDRLNVVLDLLCGWRPQVLNGANDFSGSVQTGLVAQHSSHMAKL